MHRLTSIQVALHQHIFAVYFHCWSREAGKAIRPDLINQCAREGRPSSCADQENEPTRTITTTGGQIKRPVARSEGTGGLELELARCCHAQWHAMPIGIKFMLRSIILPQRIIRRVLCKYWIARSCKKFLTWTPESESSSPFPTLLRRSVASTAWSTV